MSKDLPELKPADLKSSRDYLRDVALAMGSLQRGFLPVSPRDWQHGLEVTMRGIATQEFIVGNERVKVLLDLVKNKIRLDGVNWNIDEYSGAELFKNFKSWLESKGIQVKLEEPEFTGGTYDPVQGEAYAETLWWLHKQFQIIKAEISSGITSPILLYPHHFDLSLVWFPYDDDKQVSIGFSTGDETVSEPYVYLTLYPEPKGFDKMLSEKLPEEAYWQKDGFSGAILTYSKMRSHPHPDELLRRFVGQLSSYAVANGF